MPAPRTEDQIDAEIEKLEFKLDANSTRMLTETSRDVLSALQREDTAIRAEIAKLNIEKDRRKRARRESSRRARRAEIGAGHEKEAATEAEFRKDGDELQRMNEAMTDWIQAGASLWPSYRAAHSKYFGRAMGLGLRVSGEDLETLFTTEMNRVCLADNTGESDVPPPFKRLPHQASRNAVPLLQRHQAKIATYGKELEQRAAKRRAELEQLDATTPRKVEVVES